MRFNWQRWKKRIFNKWVLAFCIFLLMLFFNERSSLFDRIHYTRELQKVRNENEYLKTEIERVNREQNELFSNPKNMEKFAREKYFMKRDDEDVFVVMDSLGSRR